MKNNVHAHPTQPQSNHIIVSNPVQNNTITIVNNPNPIQHPMQNSMPHHHPQSFFAHPHPMPHQHPVHQNNISNGSNINIHHHSPNM